MSKVFFDSLVNHQDLITELDTHQLDPEEQQELVSIIDEILHHHILNLIFSHLPKEHHSEFASLLHQKPHDPSLIDYLKVKIDIDIEATIRSHASKIKSDISREIKKSRTHSRS